MDIKEVTLVRKNVSTMKKTLDDIENENLGSDIAQFQDRVLSAVTGQDAPAKLEDIAV